MDKLKKVLRRQNDETNGPGILEVRMTPASLSMLFLCLEL